jgi:hypothetical protein
MHERAIHRSSMGSRPRVLHTRRMASARLEVRLFLGAAAVLVLHVAVDAFVAPEPGTGPADHFVRGGTAFAVLALAAVTYSRLRAGARAAVAATLSVLSLEATGLAIADARAVGARGEDWTGFLLAPVGLVLLGLAVVLFWRSSKPGRLRYLRRSGSAASASPSAAR